MQVKNDVTSRYLGVFASRAIADEWWRAVSTCPNARIRGSIGRISPQFYTHDPTLANVVTTLTDAQGAPQFLSKVFFTLLNDRDARVMSIAAPEHSRDLISGQTSVLTNLASL